ncbi:MULTISPECIES: hypothetical protein [unclassified Brenneria]|nr:MULTISPECIES: hypothetical protein [unclassified Brenneria]MBJ7221094.1 hypothetical protein [Brenneria sp. L3-3C-1]MEE3642335.1 hypothetical protein [Brenneria sp. L3_3C_1]MEE3650294.1 hypothetical protein [Brenneria sp. HEZEL_4_2_4]NPD00250.1 hypothetical protein [Brenneria sp. hezel4-2-4]
MRELRLAAGGKNHLAERAGLMTKVNDLVRQEATEPDRLSEDNKAYSLIE